MASGPCFFLPLFGLDLRPSEFTARRWKDYDPRTGKLAITSSRTEGEEGATKTKNSNRTIKLLRPVRDYLEQIRPLKAEPDEYIFLNQWGKPIKLKKRSLLNGISGLLFGNRIFRTAISTPAGIHSFQQC